MSKIFGGSKSKSVSENKAFPAISSAFSGLFPYAQEGASGISALLRGDTSGFNNYKNATGFDFASEQGSRGITGNAAARGLLRSGSTGKSLVEYGNNLQQTYADNYLNKLLGLAGLGINAGSLVTSAGNTQTQTEKSKPGLGGLIGGLASPIAASDRRLKKDVVKVGELDNGLGVYEFSYTFRDGRFRGVMADEVLSIKPEALGPTIGGYMTVDYSKL